MAAPARSLSLAVAEAAPRCQDELIVGAEASYALLGQVQGMAYARTVPLNVSLELTLNCNIRCLHCYNLDRDAPRGACHDGGGEADARPDLTLDEIMRLLDDLRAAGCLFLTLSGGEVFTYPHLYAVLIGPPS